MKLQIKLFIKKKMNISIIMKKIIKLKKQNIIKIYIMILILVKINFQMKKNQKNQIQIMKKMK